MSTSSIINRNNVTYGFWLPHAAAVRQLVQRKYSVVEACRVVLAKLDMDVEENHSRLRSAYYNHFCRQHKKTKPTIENYHA